MANALFSVYLVYDAAGLVRYVGRTSSDNISAHLSKLMRQAGYEKQALYHTPFGKWLREQRDASFTPTFKTIYAGGTKADATLLASAHIDKYADTTLNRFRTLFFEEV